MAKKRRKKSAGGLPAKGRMKEIADSLWSHAVRADWRNRCAVCGKGKCEAHHLVPRQFEATRYELRNGISLCGHCHQFNTEISPHQNAAGWLSWLKEHHPTIHEWYQENMRPVFDGVKNVSYYVGVIQRLRQYVEEDEFTRIVGVKFSAWLDEQNEG